MAASSKEPSEGTKKAPSADHVNKTGKPVPAILVGFFDGRLQPYDIELSAEDLKKVSGGAIKIVVPDRT
jgi:hypothetical protein